MNKNLEKITIAYIRRKDTKAKVQLLVFGTFQTEKDLIKHLNEDINSERDFDLRTLTYDTVFRIHESDPSIYQMELPLGVETEEV